MSNDINHHVVIYKRVFYALLVLTALTVGVTYVHFEVYWVGLFIGLLIACVKGYLVAANFMHLNNEKKFIYGTLLLTVVFFFVLLFMPILWKTNDVDVKNNPKTIYHQRHDDSDHEHEDHH